MAQEGARKMAIIYKECGRKAPALTSLSTLLPVALSATADFVM